MDETIKGEVMIDDYRCKFCGEWIYNSLHCCEGKYHSDWEKVEDVVLGWCPKIEEVAVEPLIEVTR